MAGKLTSSNRPETARIVERQMRNWELIRQTVERGPRRPEQGVCDFVALSRAVGLPGEEIASALADALGWPVFDQEILHVMAGDDSVRERLYGLHDERDLGWLEGILQTLGFSEYARDDYFRRLVETILSLARKGPTIFLGRAADLILPRGAGLRVRIVASRAYCLREFARREGLAEEVAAGRLEEIEQERTRFVRRHFRVEADAQTRHDVIINLERFTTPRAVELILAARELRHGA